MPIGRYVCQIGRPLVGACVKTLARWPNVASGDASLQHVSGFRRLHAIPKDASRLAFCNPPYAAL
jgi:hypothetical protein